jgi:hypothetical protein
VGACISFLTTRYATSRNIKAQLILHQEKIDLELLKEKERGEKAKRISAMMLYAEIFAVIRDCMRVASSKSRPAGLPVGESPNTNLINMIDSVTPKELTTILKIYQNIEKLKIVYRNFDEHNAFDHSTRDCTNFLTEIFSERIQGLLQMDPEVLNEDSVINMMSPDYKEAFIKIIKLKQAP